MTKTIVHGMLAAGLASFLALHAHAQDADEAAPPAAAKLGFTIGEKTTRITGPLRPDGSVDYVAALNEICSRGVTPENNAAVLLWRAMGPKDIPEKLRPKYFKMLGIEPLPDEGDYYVSLGDYAKNAGVELPPADSEEETAMDQLLDQYGEAMERPWSKKDFPVLAGWLEANERPMKLLVEASKRPRRYDPLVADEDASFALIYVLLPSVQKDREAARALVIRAMLRLEAGQLDAAWEDLLSCHRLARLSAQGPTLVEGLVGIAIDGIAAHSDRKLLQHVKLTAAQADKMRADLAALPTLRGMGEKLDVSERFMFLDSVAFVSRHGISGLADLDGVQPQGATALRAVADAMAGVLVDWDVVLTMGNEWYDRLVEAARKPTGAERRAAMAKVDADLRKFAAEMGDKRWLALELLVNPQQAATRRAGGIMVSLLLPALSAAISAEDRGQMNYELTMLAFSLAAYRADHGQYPAELEDLVPKYAPAVPDDVFTDEPLHYQRQDGGYLLYSVGLNGKDDGGKGYDDNEEDGTYGDDLVVRIKGKDK